MLDRGVEAALTLGAGMASRSEPGLRPKQCWWCAAYLTTRSSIVMCPPVSPHTWSIAQKTSAVRPCGAWWAHKQRRKQPRVHARSHRCRYDRRVTPVLRDGRSPRHDARNGMRWSLPPMLAGNDTIGKLVPFTLAGWSEVRAIRERGIKLVRANVYTGGRSRRRTDELPCCQISALQSPACSEPGHPGRDHSSHDSLPGTGDEHPNPGRYRQWSCGTTEGAPLVRLLRVRKLQQSSAWHGQAWHAGTRYGRYRVVARSNLWKMVRRRS